MKIILNSELAKMKSLETQFYDDAEHFICTLEDSCDFQDDVGEIMSIVENAGNIQDGYTITDTIRIGDTRYMVGKKKDAEQDQFCTCRTAEGGAFTDFRYFVRWFDAMQDLLTQVTHAYDQLVREHNKRSFKPVICKDCGCKLTNINSMGDVYASSHYNGTEYCDSCMIEHCVHTNCLGCERGEYPNCQFLDQKQCYMEEDD